MQKKIGAYVGKFYPPHIGHLSVIDDAVNKFDELYVIISKNDIRNKHLKETQNFDILAPELIKSWFQAHYKSNPKIKVEIFDEGQFKPYPQDTDLWSSKFKEQFPTVNYKIADASYREFNKKYFPECEFYEINREIINIHSTDIRKDIEEQLNYIIPEAKEYFAQKLQK